MGSLSSVSTMLIVVVEEMIGRQPVEPDDFLPGGL
jgi:hypothetical protein